MGTTRLNVHTPWFASMLFEEVEVLPSMISYLKEFTSQLFLIITD